MRDWSSGPDRCNGIFFTIFGTMAINLGGSSLFLHVDLVVAVVVVKSEFFRGRPRFLEVPEEILVRRCFVHFCFGEVVEGWGWVHLASTACRILKFPVSVPATTTVCPGQTSFLAEKKLSTVGARIPNIQLRIWTLWKSIFEWYVLWLWASETSREVANLTKKKSAYPRVWCKKICLSVCLSVCLSDKFLPQLSPDWQNSVFALGLI